METLGAEPGGIGGGWLSFPGGCVETGQEKGMGVMAADLSLREIRTRVLESVSRYLDESLNENRNAGRERVERFVANRAPRYRPVLGRMQTETLDVDPTILIAILTCCCTDNSQILKQPCLAMGTN